MSHIRQGNSAIDIANQALSLLGADRIQSFEDGDVNADVMATFYEQTKHSLLRSYPWNCAERVVRLQELDEEMLTSEYQHVYQLPLDNLRLLKIWSTGGPAGFGVSTYNIGYGRYPSDDSDYKFAVRGKTVYTNSKPAIAVYVADLNEGDMDSQMVQTLVYQLAVQACYGITQSNAREKMLSERAAGMLGEARTTDALEGTTKSLSASRFTQVRL